MNRSFVFSLRLGLLTVAATAVASTISGCNLLPKPGVKRPVKNIPTSLEVRTQPMPPKAGEAAIWKLKILDMRTSAEERKGLRLYQITNAKVMHMIVVARDGSRYGHFYPDQRDYGLFMAHPTLPGGTYELFLDFTPAGGTPSWLTQTFFVTGGNPKHQPSWAPDVAKDGVIAKEVRRRAEASMDEVAGAPLYTVKLKVPGAVRAKQTVGLQFTIEQNGKAVPDTQTHLGGPAYAVAVSADGSQFVRWTPVDLKLAPGSVLLRGTFPKAGIYKLWVEFRHGDGIVIAPFGLRVTA